MEDSGEVVERTGAPSDTDYEETIDEINRNNRSLVNGLRGERKRRSGKSLDYREHSDSEDSGPRNGYLIVPSNNNNSKKKKISNKNLNHNKKPLPVVSVIRGKPYSHQMRHSESSSKSHSKSVPRLVVKSGGKPRSMMLNMVSSASSKKKHAKDRSFYQSQVTEDKNNHTIKIRIKKANTDVKKSKRKKSHQSTPKVKTSKKIAIVESDFSDDEEEEQEEEEEEEIETEPEPEPEIRKHRCSSSSRSGRSKKALRKASLIAKATQMAPVVVIPNVVVTPTLTKPKETKKKASKSHSKSAEERPPVQQGPWGSNMPQEVLVSIFGYATANQGVLPTLLRVGEVCRLWHTASTTPQLWSSVELAHHTKDKWKTDHRLVWLMENRLTMCQHLNLSNWKVSNLAWVVESLVVCCPMLEELNLTGWKRLSVDQLKDVTHGLNKLGRLDLSCTSEASSSGGCLSVASLTQMSRGMGDRLTHLTLANNKLAGLPVILNSIADHCPNLELLDLSNLWAVSHPAMVPLERLQKGCSKLKVLRITNSQVVLATASTQDQMESPGFPLLEELSVACPSVDYKLVDDEALGRILKSSTSLRLLDVRGCIRITDSGLIKVPAWDLQHLFLSGCAVTRQCRSCLELICEKWSHSLLEVDLAWATATQPLDAAVDALADKGQQSRLRILNLCGSSVSLEPVRKMLTKCPNLESVNLASCRALPRGMKRHYLGQELQDLKDSFDPVKKKEKEEQDRLAKEKKKKALEDARKLKEDAKLKEEGKDVGEEAKNSGDSESSVKDEGKSDVVKSPDSALDSPANINNSDKNRIDSASEVTPSTDPEYSPQPNNTFSPAPKSAASTQEPFSPQPSTSGLSTPRSNLQDFGTTSNQVTADSISASNTCDSDSRQGTPRASNSWNVEQCSPMNKQETLSSSQPSPDTVYSPANAMRQDTPKSTGSWNMGNYSPSVTRQDSPYPSHSPSVHRQESPYSSQNSPSVMRQESPYSSQKSPSIARLESPYSSQKSPSVASPYSTQIRSPSVVRQDLSPYSSVKSPSVIRQESPYSSVKSPSMVRQESPYSSHSPSVVRQESPYASHVSPSVVRQESPYSSHVSPSMARQESPYASHVSPSVVRQESPYSSQKSPYQSVKSPYTSQKSPDPPVTIKPNHSGNWGVEPYSPVMRQESASSSQPSPETTQVVTRPWNIERFSPMPSSNNMMPSPDTSQVTSTGKPWNMDGTRFSPMARVDSSPAALPSPEMSAIKPSQSWNIHPSPETGQSILKTNWTMPSHFNPLIRPEQSPIGPMTAQPLLDIHKASWNSMNQFDSKVDSSNSVLQSAAGLTAASLEPLPSMWGLRPITGGSSLLVNNKSDSLQRTASSAAYLVGDQVTTTTFCANPDPSMLYRNFRDPLNGPSSVD